jgi:predicted amidohydrolase YtcJ
VFKVSMSMKRRGAERITSTLSKSKVVRVASGSDCPVHGLFYNPFLSCSQAVLRKENPAFSTYEACSGWQLPRSKGRTL